MGRPTDPLAVLEALRSRPYAYEFYQAMRLLENLHRDKPRLGDALRPADEPVRLGQEASLSFAPGSLTAFEPGQDGNPSRLRVNFFGLLGPNGPLPLHLTEYTRGRTHHAGDPTLQHFFDLLHHRLLLLFYRIWAQAQPAVSLDRPQDDRFSTYIGALVGQGLPAFRDRDSVHDFAKFFRAHWLARRVRNADGLRAILCSYFAVPARIEQFVGHWMRLPLAQRTRLGVPGGTTLGKDAVIGEQVWDRQHKFRIHLGPLTFKEYESFLPGGGNIPKLVDWVRTYFSFQFQWDVRLALKQAEVPKSRLGRYSQLGWTSWLGKTKTTAAAEDLVLDAEAVLARSGAAAAATTMRKP
ncbi:MAG: type VI secretion system baseplate subunit TssG [Betaproteobacteria bacterium]